MDKMKTISVLSLAAPPFSGKSTLAVLLGQHLLNNGWAAFYIPLSHGVLAMQTVMEWSGTSLSDFLDDSTSPPTFLLFDDAQAIYGHSQQNSFWDIVKRHESVPLHPVKLIFFSTVRKEISIPSPFVFSHRLSAAILLAHEEDVKELFDDFDLLASRPLGAYLRGVVGRLAGGHLGLLHQLLYKIFEQRNAGEADDDAQMVSSFLDDRFHSYLQGLRITFAVNSFTAAQRRLLLKALDGEFSPQSDTSDRTDCTRLVDFGLLVELQPDVFGFPSPLIRRVILKHLFSSTARPAIAPSSLPEFLLQSLRLLKVF